MLGQTIINGLLAGGLYGVIAIGFSMIWGVMGVINMAHGSMAMIGAYLSLFVFERLGIDPFLSIPITFTVLFAFGFAFQSIVVNPLIRRNLLLSLVLTFGLDLVIINAVVLLATADLRAVNTSYTSRSFELAGMLFPIAKLMTFGIALLLAGCFYFFVNRMKYGQAIMATALDKETVRLMGINPDRVYALTGGVSAALAGAAGSAASTVVSISPYMGFSFLGASFVVAVLGGIGSIEGAIVGGLLYGLVQSLAAALLGANYQDTVAFCAFLAVLVFRPKGLLGKKFFG